MTRLLPHLGWRGWLLTSGLVIVLGWCFWRGDVVDGKGPALADAPNGFSGARAYRCLQEICQLGPRMTGSASMARQQQMLERHFTQLGGKVVRQKFVGTQPSIKDPFECVNLIVHWHAAQPRQRRILIGAHYDTRPIADQDPIVRNRTQPILGANDGASGVALLMELARHADQWAGPVGVDFVCFDAEEYMFQPKRDHFFLGSEHFVKEYNDPARDYQYEAVIIVDMIADQELRIHPDQHSSVRSGRLVDEVWTLAEQMHVPAFRRSVKYDLQDDHVSFERARPEVPAIVLIDFDYPHWHRLSDVPEQCSAASLQQVGQVVLEWLRRRQEQPQ